MNPLATEPESNEEPVQTMDERLVVYRQVILSVIDT
jgi:hypothetical protein